VPIALTMKDASHESGLSVRTLYQLIGAGNLQSTTVGRRRLVLVKSLTEVVTHGVRVERPTKDPAPAQPGEPSEGNQSAPSKTRRRGVGR